MHINQYVQELHRLNTKCIMYFIVVNKFFLDSMFSLPLLGGVAAVFYVISKILLKNMI